MFTLLQNIQQSALLSSGSSQQWLDNHGAISANQIYSDRNRNWAIAFVNIPWQWS